MVGDLVYCMQTSRSPTIRFAAYRLVVSVSLIAIHVAQCTCELTM